MVSCNIKPQVATITIKNKSGEEVRNLTVFYDHASKEKTQKEKITSLSNNESRTLSLELTSPSMALGVGMIVVFGEIEYYINETKFNMDNGDGDITLSAGEFKTIITINETGWTVDRKK